MQLATLDIVIIVIYAIGLFSLAQWISRGHGGKDKDRRDKDKNAPDGHHGDEGKHHQGSDRDKKREKKAKGS